MLRICTLAALLAVAGTAWADQTAYFTARYGGWSKDPSCDNTANGRRCWVMTIGKSNWNHEAADLSYTCRTDGEEWLSIGFWAQGVIDTKMSSLSVKWDHRHEEALSIWVLEDEYRGKPQYWLNLSDPEGFMTRVRAHEILTVTLPYRDNNGRHVKGKFPMRNAMRSIAATMRECGITRSTLGEVSG